MYMLDAMVDSKSQAELSNIIWALPQIGRDSTRPLFAALQTKDISIKAEIIRQEEVWRMTEEEKIRQEAAWKIIQQERAKEKDYAIHLLTEIIAQQILVEVIVQSRIIPRLSRINKR